jgi:hypothetical protein
VQGCPGCASAHTGGDLGRTHRPVRGDGAVGWAMRRPPREPHDAAPTCTGAQRPGAARDRRDGRRRESRSSSFDISSLRSSARCAVLASAGAIGCAWQRSAGCSPGAMVGVPGPPTDAASMAPRAGAQEVDVPSSIDRRSAAHRRGRPRPHRADGRGEPSVGVHADQRRAGQARNHSLRDRDPDGPASPRARTCPTAVGSDME